jgi:NDP-sugar pyrophosphorylase family protein
MVADGSLSLDSVSFDEKAWYEIDTVEDLMKAEKLFLTKKTFATKLLKTRMRISEKNGNLRIN